MKLQRAIFISLLRHDKCRGHSYSTWEFGGHSFVEKQMGRNRWPSSWQRFVQSMGS